MPETSELRNKTRLLKSKAIDKAIAVLSDPKDPLYNETYLTVLKNTVPRTQEITGEEGEAIQVSLVKYAEIITPNTTQEGS